MNWDIYAGGFLHGFAFMAAICFFYVFLRDRDRYVGPPRPRPRPKSRKTEPHLIDINGKKFPPEKN